MADRLLLEFLSFVAAVECAIAIQKLMAEGNADAPEAKRIVFRNGVNLGDVLIEGHDILGEGVNIAARLEAICDIAKSSLFRLPRRARRNSPAAPKPGNDSFGQNRLKTV